MKIKSEYWMCWFGVVIILAFLFFLVFVVPDVDGHDGGDDGSFGITYGSHVRQHRTKTRERTRVACTDEHIFPGLCGGLDRIQRCGHLSPMGPPHGCSPFPDDGEHEPYRERDLAPECWHLPVDSS